MASPDPPLRPSPLVFKPYNMYLMTLWFLSLVLTRLTLWLRRGGSVEPPREGDHVWQGRTVVVTGASRGLGQEVAQALARRGAHVVCASLPDGGAAASAAEMINLKLPLACPGYAEAVDVDLADVGSVRRLAEDLRRGAARDGRRRPPLAALVNNAAVIAGARREVPGGFEEALAVNHLGPLLLTLLLLPSLSGAPRTEEGTGSGGGGGGSGGRVAFVGSFTHRAVTREAFRQWLDAALPDGEKGGDVGGDECAP